MHLDHLWVLHNNRLWPNMRATQIHGYKHLEDSTTVWPFSKAKPVGFPKAFDLFGKWTFEQVYSTRYEIPPVELGI